MRLLVYGGSFNPPHLGHAYALRTAAEYLQPDRILVIPAGIPPHKALAEESPTADERFRLCELAFGGIPGAEISDMELRREGKSYTVDTLREIRREDPEADLWFLVGTDMLLYMEKWFQFREIFDLCTLAALPRNEGELPELQRSIDHLHQTYGEEVTLIPRLPMPMDSTSLRTDLPLRGGRDRLEPAVYREIIRSRHYNARPDLSWLRDQVKPLLKPGRYAHTLGVEETAVRLAGLYGADPGEAAEAALLHDVTKRLSPEEQLRLCEKYGIILDKFEQAEPKLLHALTGAAFARAEYGVSEDVYRAIRWHTTGRPEMSRLEMIVWLADCIEPGRDFPGVDRLRDMAERDLEQAMEEALRATLALVSGRGGAIHPNTALALQWFEQRKEKEQ